MAKLTVIKTAKKRNRAAQDTTLINTRKLQREIIELREELDKLVIKVESINSQYFKK